MLALLLTSTTARAVLQFDVFIGYDGIVREASWFPVMCEIKNDGLPISGFVEISPGNYNKGQTYQIAVELPTGTLKRVTIPVFSPSRQISIWNIRLTDRRGKTIAEQTAQRPRRQIGWEIPLIGSLSRTASGAATLRPIQRDQDDAKPAAARLLPQIFPDNPLVLEGLNALYLNTEIVAGLRESQADAILGWMNAGGHLIVGMEQVSDVTASPWLRNVLPCEPKTLKTITAHTELQSWLRSRLDYVNPNAAQINQQFNPQVPRRSGRQAQRENVSAEAPFAEQPDDTAFELADIQVATGTLRDGRVVVSAGGAPLVITSNRGKGRLTVLMFSPEREPFKSWKNLPTMWSRLVEVPGTLYASADYYQGSGQSADGIFGAMIDSRQVHKLPIGWLLILLVVYLVIIGPFDQWWLKRIGKPMLTWITFPCYVVLFSLLIYFIGYKLRAGESEYTELHLVDVLRNGDKAELRGRTYASIYAPSNAKFLLESKQKFATFRGEFLGYGSEATERATVLQNGDSFSAEVFVPVWTSQLFTSDWWSGSAAPFDIVIKPRGDGWNVIVKNNTDHAVKSAQLVIENRVVTLAEIAAGGTLNMNLTREQGTALAEFVRQYGSNFQRVSQQRQNAFGASKGGRLSDIPNTAAAASFLSQMRPDQNYNNMRFISSPGLDLSQYVERGGAVLLAWTPGFSPVTSLNQFKPRRFAKNTLWRIPVSVGP
ncbi:MAG: hypothetical protein EXS35_14895 [Pedosphaera sp.]|nr:hypothetical protein [Pedosphaera sp.]